VSAAEIHSTISYTNAAGEHVLATADLVPGIDWVVVLEVSLFEATQLSQAALVLLIAISILGWLVVRRFVINRYETLVLEPVRQLQTGAEKVAGDDLTYAIPIRRNDELGEVSAAFNRMVARLRENNEIVELQTNALTTEILERMKVEATLEVTVQDLVAATARAQESSRLKSQFLANMSHELRTPLNTILGYSGIMLDGIAGQLDDNAKSMLLKVQRSGKALLELINDVLDIAKIESGRLTLMTVPFSIRAAVDEWQAQIGVVALQKHLTFQATVAPDVPEYLDGDKVRVSQIALNLLSNAVKFTKTGTVTLTIDWKADAIELVVSDTGIGIPAESLGLIFEEFRQVDGSSRREYGGSGLGLAIVRHLCVAMGGTVAVSSEVDKGSAFTVRLPLPAVDLDALTTILAERGLDV
jgi:signal transduction histidine kinase